MQLVTVPASGGDGSPASGYSPWDLTGGAFATILGDGVGATYVSKGAGSWPANPWGTVFFSAPSLPAGARINYVQPRFSLGMGAAGSGVLDVTLDDSTQGGPTAPMFLMASPKDSFFRDVWAPSQPTNRVGSDWLAADVGHTVIYMTAGDPYGGGHTDTFVSQVSLDVYYSRQGSVVVNDFLNNSVQTAKPTFTWTSIAPDNPGNPQAGFIVRVFDAATYTQPGFDPMKVDYTVAGLTGFIPLYDSGLYDNPTTDSSSRSYKVLAPLPLNQTLRAYVIVEQPWGGTNGDGWESWDYTEFVVDMEAIAPPVLVAKAYDAAATVDLALGGNFNMVDLYASGFEYPVGQAEWRVESGLDYAVVVNNAGGAYPADEWEVKITNGAVAGRAIRGPMLTGHGGALAFGVVSMTVWAHGFPCNVRMGMRFFRADGSQTGSDYWAGVNFPLTAEAITRYSINFNTAPGDTVYAAVMIETQPGATTGGWLRIRELRMPSISGWLAGANCQTFCVVKPDTWSNVGDGIVNAPGGSKLALLVSAAATGNIDLTPIIPPAINPGQEYTAQTSIRPIRGAGVRQARMIASFLDSSAAIISFPPNGPNVPTTGAAWNDVKAQFTGGAGSAYIIAEPQIQAAAAGEQFLIDKFAIYPGHVGDYGAGGWTVGSAAAYQVQRSINGGTWEDVAQPTPLVIDPKVQTNVLSDRAAPRGKAVAYRARATATNDQNGTNTSAWSPTAQTALGITDAWLKCPQDPSLDMPVKHIPPFRPEEGMPAGIFDDVIGAEVAYAMTDGHRKATTFDLVVQVDGDAALTALQKMLRTRKVLLFQDTIGRQWYVMVNGKVSYDLARANPILGSLLPIRSWNTVTVPCVEVGVPT